MVEPRKIALVSGASRGLGRAIALRLAREGIDVAVNYLEHREEAEAVRDAIEEAGCRSLVVQANVSLQAEVERMMSAIESGLGSIDILVNNAGIARQRTIDELDEEAWNETIAVNLTSVFLLIQAVLPAMRARGWGRIINISSAAAQIGGLVGPHYAASKAGILGLTRGYASLLAKEGITVNAVAPALVETDMLAGISTAAKRLIPVRRFGRPQEVSDVVAMLVANGYVTGQTINVNGGAVLS